MGLLSFLRRRKEVPLPAYADDGTLELLVVAADPAVADEDHVAGEGRDRDLLPRRLLGRGVVELALEDGGLRVERGGGPWCIPAADLRGVEVTSHHAGKEVYADKVLVVDWRLGPTTLRSGFVLDEATAPAWAARLRPLVAR